MLHNDCCELYTSPGVKQTQISYNKQYLLTTYIVMVVRLQYSHNGIRQNFQGRKTLKG